MENHHRRGGVDSSTVADCPSVVARRLSTSESGCQRTDLEESQNCDLDNR